MDIVISVLKEQESKGSMDDAFTLASWDDPYLGVMVLGVLESQCSCCKLEVVDWFVDFLEHFLDIICILFY